MQKYISLRKTLCDTLYLISYTERLFRIYMHLISTAHIFHLNV